MAGPALTGNNKGKGHDFHLPRGGPESFAAGAAA